MKPITIGLLGLGTVGTGVVNLIKRNKDLLSRRTGIPLQITHAVVRDINLRRACNLDGIKLSTDPQQVVANSDIDIVVELMGGIQPALGLLNTAISQGKSIVTANKALIAEHGEELFSLASQHHVDIAFEAAVAGGIPIIKAIREGLAGNRIRSLTGIINGTGNYILSAMLHQQRDFNEVLAEAQELGYAEADPTFDVEGIDAAHKLTILASLAFGMPLRFAQVFTEGIGQVTQEDIQYAKQLGYRIKQLAIARLTNRGAELRVHPTLIPEHQLLANVEGVMNAVLVDSDAVGQSLYHGAGAGAGPTASAVVADLIDVARTLRQNAAPRVPYLAFQPEQLVDYPVLKMADIETAYYLHLKAVDEPGVLADVTKILAELEISIEAIQQKEPTEGETEVSVIILTHRVREQNMNSAIEQIEKLSRISGKLIRIRLEHLHPPGTPDE